MLPTNIAPASLLYGFANSARTFPFDREAIWQAFEDYADYMWPGIDPLVRRDKITTRWNTIMGGIVK